MRFGLAATVAMLAATSCPVGDASILLPSNGGDAVLPSVANRPARGGGMNAHQLARLSAKNARRRRR